MLIILKPEYKLITAEQIDQVVCGENPDPAKNPILHDIVKGHMIHGPCGRFNPTRPCMVPSKKGSQSLICSKHFPKEFADETVINKDGYFLNRRRQRGDKSGFTATFRSGDREFTVDNRWVVPYNKYLSERFDTHVNVEVCSSVQSVKYLYK